MFRLFLCLLEFVLFVFCFFFFFFFFFSFSSPFFFFFLTIVQIADMLTVEGNMQHRRKLIYSVLAPGETYMTITSFPRAGCPAFTLPPHMPQPDGPGSQSLFFPDEAINQVGEKKKEMKRAFVLSTYPCRACRGIRAS